MTNYTIWADRGSGADKIYEIGKYLKKCAGGSVKILGIGPNVGQSYGLHNGKGTVGVFMTNGVGLATPNDFEMGCKPGGYYQYEKCIFVWPQYIGNQYMSDEQIKKHIVPGEHDWNRDSSYNLGGQTATQWFPNAKYVDLVAGTSPQDIAQRICNGAFVTSSGNPSSSSSSSDGSSGSQGSNGSGESSTESSNTSPLLQGDMTFEELVGEICNGLDIMFLCKRSTVVVTDFETIYAEAKYLRDNHYSAVSAEDIKLWQLEDDSYELDINQHGFYNTVYVEYNKGKVRESFDDFVKVYGEVPITYTDRNLNKSSAIMKAKAYLAAHLRDLEMTVNATILSEPNIDIGDIVTLDNPKTMQNKNKRSKGISPEFLFVKGVNTSWDGEGYIESDLEMQFSPTSPEKREVPTHGTKNCNQSSSSSSDSSTQTTSTGTYGSCGLSSDKKTICAIGKASAPGEASKYGGDFYRSIFKNKCPFCNKETLVWDIFWAGESSNYGYSQCKGTSEGGSGEGHIFCKNCDADFSTVDGKDHENPPRAKLSRADSGPVKVSKTDAYSLKKGMYSL